MELNLDITGIQHIGIPVTDLNASRAFYGRLGFKNVMEACFMQDGEPGTCVMMQRGNILMELYQLPAHALDEIRARKNGHIDHVAFDVPDIEAAYTTLKQAGFTIIEPEPVFLQFWDKGCKYFNITGPDQERLEFNQIL